MDNSKILELLSTNIHEPGGLEYLITSTVSYLQDSRDRLWAGSVTPKFNALCKKITLALSVNYPELPYVERGSRLNFYSDRLDSQILIYRGKDDDYWKAQSEGGFSFLARSFRKKILVNAKNVGDY